MYTPTAQCLIWRDKILSRITVIKSVIESELHRLDETEGYVIANTWLRGIAKRLSWCDQYVTELSGEQLVSWADRQARLTEVGFHDLFNKFGKQRAIEFLEKEAAYAGFEFCYWHDMDRVLGMAARMFTAAWWARQAKRQWVVVEQVLRECGQVHRKASPYVSSFGLNKFRIQQQNNRAFLEGWEAVNDQGQAFTLAQLSEKGISNPDNRKAELMVRIRGFEEMAVEFGHDSYFVTVTCPSKYHPTSGGRRNRKYLKADSPTVREAQAYLNTLWRRFRAYCKNHGIDFYGLRTVEPHHDGCPHWHLITFVKPSQAEAFLSAFRRYAFAENGNERGADKHRFTVVKIDPAKGTAAGYVAKYVAKNISGDHIDYDNETGKSGRDAAERITAWARLNRIRQFQFVGGVSVTVWRELRRLGVDAAPSMCKEIYHAANRADWSAFVKLMGGVFAGRDQALKPHYSEPTENQFGEMVATLKGVALASGIEAVITRLYDWTIQRIGTDSQKSALEDGFAVPWTRVNNCTPPSGGGKYQPIYQ